MAEIHTDRRINLYVISSINSLPFEYSLLRAFKMSICWKLLRKRSIRFRDKLRDFDFVVKKFNTMDQALSKHLENFGLCPRCASLFTDPKSEKMFEVKLSLRI